ncbi:LysM domain-containing protein [Rubritalea squalenifaciens DSM 18772]|uniref:LysM domain-containing protein n=2 Tax=Rubritalea TaxID=361050 RepID=A0A1M6NVX3_9BACT|nr:LysM peptidoglycan-binding domain-containing protein [Rubritalea squalenifaciens]SHJ99835.1 LysM domain-containing protein [Rubritalea squalenifaciens DSM 18772]
MKIQLLILSTAAGLLFTSCEKFGGNASNPYGAPAAAPNNAGYANASNPYAAPMPNGETNAYANNNPNYLPNSGPNAAPYQPIPSAAPSVEPAGGNYIPSPGAAVPAGATTPHTIVAGDTLWGLARKYNTSVEAIQRANGMTNTIVQLGQTIQIPSN